MSTFDIGDFSGSQNYSGFVNSTDLFDLYKFNLSKTGSFTISLNNLTNNADLQVINSNGDILYNSNNSDINSEIISIDNFGGG